MITHTKPNSESEDAPFSFTKALDQVGARFAQQSLQTYFQQCMLNHRDPLVVLHELLTVYRDSYPEVTGLMQMAHRQDPSYWATAAAYEAFTQYHALRAPDTDSLVPNGETNTDT